MILQRRVEITKAPNAHIIGLNGTVTRETKKMLVLETKNGSRMVPKQGLALQIDGTYVSGDDLRGRLHERLTGP